MIAETIAVVTVLLAVCSGAYAAAWYARELFWIAVRGFTHPSEAEA